MYIIPKIWMLIRSISMVAVGQKFAKKKRGITVAEVLGIETRGDR